MKDFSEKVLRSAEGKKVVVKCISDKDDTYYFYPKKLDIKSKDQYDSIMVELRKSTKMSADAKRLLLQKMDERKQKDPESDPNVYDIISELTPEEVAIVEAGTSVEKINNSEIYEVVISNGIGRHNFHGQEEEGIKDDDIKIIMKNPDMAMEIYKAIEAVNHFFQSRPKK